MILAISGTSHFFEDVVTELVIVQFGGIQNTSARGRRTCIGRCRLLALKLLDQIVHIFGSLVAELVELRVNTSKDINTFGSFSCIILIPVFFCFVPKLLVVDNDFVRVNLGELNISGRLSMTLDQTLSSTVKVTLSGDVID